MATVTVTEATRTETVPGPTTPERGSQGGSKHGGVSTNNKKGGRASTGGGGRGGSSGDHSQSGGHQTGGVPVFPSGPPAPRAPVGADENQHPNVPNDEGGGPKDAEQSGSGGLLSGLAQALGHTILSRLRGGKNMQGSEEELMQQLYEEIYSEGGNGHSNGHRSPSGSESNQ